VDLFLRHLSAVLPSWRRFSTYPAAHRRSRWPLVQPSRQHPTMLLDLPRIQSPVIRMGHPEVRSTPATRFGVRACLTRPPSLPGRGRIRSGRRRRTPGIFPRFRFRRVYNRQRRTPRRPRRCSTGDRRSFPRLMVACGSGGSCISETGCLCTGPNARPLVPSLQHRGTSHQHLRANAAT